MYVSFMYVDVEHESDTENAFYIKINVLKWCVLFYLSRFKRLYRI